MAYERKLGKFLQTLRLPGTLHAAQWLEFEDANGHGYALPDFFIVCPTVVVLLESKLTQVDVAWPQMRELYSPLLEWVYQRRVCCIQVCKHLSHEGDPIVASPRELKDGVVWHWLGEAFT